MRWTFLIVLIALSPAVAFAQGAKAKTGIAVWDTVKPVSPQEPLTKRAGWTGIPLDKTTDAFQGDAVLGNGRITVVLRQKGGAIEVHGNQTGAGSRFGLRLQSSTGEPVASVERIALIENSKTGATLQATFKTAKGVELTAKLRLKRGDVAVQVEPGIGAAKLRLECPSRFVVLPDFFADDITLDATKMPLAAVELPSENFLLHLAGKGDTIAMCVFENRQQDVKVTLVGNREVTGSEIPFGKKKIWVALLEARHIWHAHDVAAADTGKIVKLDWTMPFPAQWRVDFTKPDNLTDSWEMLLQDRGYVSYVKPSWFGRGDEVITSDRDRWNTVLGSYAYPAWSDTQGRGYFQPIKSKHLRFTGPALIYPIHRVKDTPLDAFTVVDVMRNTLGVGPCEHILDLDGQKEEYRGRATCGVRDKLNPIYANGEQKGCATKSI